jgi:hypothetical protein
MNKEEISKVTQVIYDCGINTTGRLQNTPKDNDKILKPIKLAVINIGIDMVKKEKFVRASFVGSPAKYYDYYVTDNQMNKWFDKLKEHTFEEIDDFEKEDIW